MLTPSEYLALKTRMLLAAEAAALVCRSTDAVRFDEEMYPIVMEALASNKSDVRRVLAESDILRHMNQQALFPTLQGVANASGDDAKREGVVDSVPLPTVNEDGGRPVRADSASDGGDVPARGTDEVREAVPKPRRNRGRKKGTAKPVGRDNEDGAVGG